MLYPDKMERPLSDSDRAWLKWNNMGHIADQFDAEDADGARDDAVPYSKWTVAELTAEIEKRNEEIDNDDEKLSTDGKKAELIKTLEADDELLAANNDE